MKLKIKNLINKKTKSTFDFMDFANFTDFRLYRLYRLNSGFSLFELLVVISIVVMMASVTFSGFPKMNSKLGLDLLAQDVALTARQAQIYGTTVFGVEETEGQIQQAKAFQAYGVSFPSPEFRDEITGQYSYTLFADVSKSAVPGENGYDHYNIYNEGDTLCLEDPKRCAALRECGNPGFKLGKDNECVEVFKITGTDELSDICLDYFSNKTSGVDWDKNKRVAECQKLDPGTKDLVSGISKPRIGSSVDIVYRRPKLQATIIAVRGAGTGKAGNVGLVLRSESGDTRVVVLWSNGQIQIDR